MDERPTFFFDVGSPWCWVAGERLGGKVVWEPVLARALGASAPVDHEAIEAAAETQGLPPVRWPDPWPEDTAFAMRAASFAKSTGRVVAFSLAAMRQAYLAGRDLSVQENVLIAAAACELHPRALLKGVETRAARESLEAATQQARTLEVDTLPAFIAGERVLCGPQAIEEIAAATWRE